MPTEITKPWGREVVVADEDYCGKVLHVRAGFQTSWHYHPRKGETLYVISGRGVLYYGEGDGLDDASILMLSEGSSFHVPPGLRHRLQAMADLEVAEFGTRREDGDAVRLIAGGET